MTNPWEQIPLSDYENHMSLDSVQQLQSLNYFMRSQLEQYPVSTVMILGIAGGNGLEYISTEKYRKVYAIDINEDYLETVRERYTMLNHCLECLQIDLMSSPIHLPQAELLIANLLIEYIGYAAFQRVVHEVQPTYISCVI